MVNISWNFKSWLGAPFLKQLTSQQVYELMVGIKDVQTSGALECAIDNGGVRRIYFQQGKPLGNRDQISLILNHPDVVVAWMPQSADEVVQMFDLVQSTTKPTTAPDVVAVPTSTVVSPEQSIRAEAQKIFGGFHVFSGPSGWFALIEKTHILAHSLQQAEFSGASILTGLVAQANSAFADLLRDKPLRRFTLDCGDVRFGYEALGGAWTTMYRTPAANQRDVSVCTQSLRKLLADGVDGEQFTFRSRFIERPRGTYAMIRPQFYRQLERTLRRELDRTGIAWSQIWYKHDSKFVYAMPDHGESTQEINGSLEQLLVLIRQSFEPLAGALAENLVLHTDNATIWIDFSPEGFWATRFDSQEITLRSTAESISNAGLNVLRRNAGDSTKP